MKNSFSKYISPLLIVSDLSLINLIVFWVADANYIKPSFLIYINLGWLFIAYFFDYYKVFRTTHFLKVLYLYLMQSSIFFLTFFTYFSLFKEGIEVNNQFKVIASIIIATFSLKFIYFYLLKWYRLKGKNFRRVVVIGQDESSKKIINFFKSESDYGFRFIGFFSDKESRSKDYKGTIKESLNFILKNGIQEVYCSRSSLNLEAIKKFIKFGDQHSITVKILPDTKDLYSKSLDLEYYGVLPVLKTNKLPFHFPETHIIKRIFDVVFSLIVIIFLLSWLTPLLWILIKLDSRGSVFFFQERTGFKGDKFYCYKFRSMEINKFSDQKQVSEDDHRITKVGKFLRKTSMDELPQFFNVLLGDMSVVGPRPHMKSQSLQFEKEVSNFIKRHQIKPGITGLAQISGYRGEIQKKSDIENRVRLDIFYMENWSFFLDIKIVIQTVLNVFKGDEKAY